MYGTTYEYNTHFDYTRSVTEYKVQYLLVIAIVLLCIQRIFATKALFTYILQMQKKIHM